MTVIKMNRMTKEKTGRYGVANKIKMASNLGSVTKTESRYEALLCGEKT